MWKRACMSLWLAVFVWAGVGSLAVADDFYVNATTGDDSRSGTSPREAWRHVSYALAVVPSGDHTVHLAPGVYSTEGGEVWPLPIRDGIAILGDGGSEQTELLGGWFQHSGTSNYYHLDARGLTLRGGQTGIDIFAWHYYAVRLDLTDVRILQMSEYGIRADGYAGPFDGYQDFTWCHAVLDRVLVADCGAGGVALSLTGAYFGAGDVDVVAVDCEVRDCGGIGFWTGADGAGTDRGWASTYLSRCRILRNAEEGVVAWILQVFPGSGNSLTMEDCLVAGNGGDGVDSQGFSNSKRSTLVDNGGYGLRGHGELESCIVWGNRAALSPWPRTVEYSCVEGSSAPVGQGNLNAFPQFVDAAGGDYSLRFDSPCVDAGDPGDTGVLDVAGLSRPIDGNLDTIARVDMGAHEHAPLHARGPARIGQPLTLELWGPMGGSATLFWCRGPLRQPLSTPFGDWELGRSRLLFATSGTAPGPPALFTLPVAQDPLLIGTTFSLQSLTTSVAPGAPPWVLTNALELTVLE